MRKYVCINALTAAVGAALFSVGVGAASPQITVQQSNPTTVQASVVGRYVVTFVEPGLLRYKGGTNGINATAPAATGARKLDVNSSESQAYAQYLDTQRNAHIATIEQMLGHPLNMPHQYGTVKNGISAELSVEEANRIATLPGVLSVKPVREYSRDTFRGPKFIGADKIWDGSATPTHTGTKGQGIKVGIIDSGTHIGHPSFANDASCGFSDQNPKLHAVDCTTSTASGCTGTSPDAATSGHGVHTSSTVAGNTLDNSANPSPNLPEGVSMSGVAPCATIYTYKACDATCNDDDLLAGIESLARDQIDAANFSIGPTCGGGSPWDDEDRDFLDAINADVFVAASAGNTRSNCTSPISHVSHIGPWMLTVAASTQDQQLGQARVDVVSPTAPALIQSIGVTAAQENTGLTTPTLTGVPLRSYPANVSGCTDTGGFPAGYFTGAVAVIRRGFVPPSTTACTFTEKVTNAANAGALVAIIANNKNDAQGITAPGEPITTFKINDLATSDALLAFLAENGAPPTDPDVIFEDGFDGAAPAGVTGDFTPGVSLVQQQGDVLASFSDRGPTLGNFVDLTKPDITGPGVSIYAAGRVADGNYFVLSGTSMSGPHVAGSGALIRSVHPDWTVQEVKSALMTTSFNGGFQEDGVTAWNPDQVGSGRVDLTKAALAGLVMDETYANFVAANPNGGTIDLKTLNVPSVRNMECATTCTWTRKVKNVLSTSGSWNTAGTGDGFGLTVSPASFTLAAGATQTLTITATPTGTLSDIKFGTITLTEANGQSPEQHLTAAVKSGGNTPPGDCTNGNCVFKIDTLPDAGGSFSLIGCSTFCGLMWVNRYSPDAADFPITINSVTTIFGTNTGANAAGDKINVYVYQDDDNDPTNGATALGSPTHFTMPAPTSSLLDIPLAAPIVVSNPGDLVVALTNTTGNTGLRPASADSGPFAGRSYLADATDAGTGSAPNLATAGLVLNTAAISGFVGNWIVRVNATNAAGRPIVLDTRLQAPK